MSEEKKDNQSNQTNQTLRFVCIAVGVAASLLTMRFVLGQTGALYGAVAGALGVFLGIVLFEMVLKIKG